MRNIARNVSIVTNLMLLIVVVGCFAWMWRTQQLSETQGESAKDYRRMSKIYEGFILDKLAAIDIVGLKLPKVVMESLGGDVISTDFSGKKAAIVLMFKPVACQPCLITQLKALQLIQESVIDTADIAVLAIGKSPPITLKRFTRAFGLTYPVISDSAGQVLTEDLAQTTPVVMLVNNQNTIIDAHIPSPARPEFSLLFYNELKIARRTGVNLDWEKYDFGLGGQPKIDVILNQFDDSNPNVGKLIQ